MSLNPAVVEMLPMFARPREPIRRWPSMLLDHTADGNGTAGVREASTQTDASLRWVKVSREAPPRVNFQGASVAP